MEFNLADLFQAVADHVPHREALVAGPVRLTFAQLDKRANRAAHVLSDLGLSAGDHVGLALRNGNEMVELMLGAFNVGVVPINVNYHYTADELRYLFCDAQLDLIVHEPDLADRVDDARASMTHPPAVLERGTQYELALATRSDERPTMSRTGDAPYILYTGGTTGMPKGVIWRHEDIFFAAMGGGSRTGTPIDQPEDIVAQLPLGSTVSLPASPLMHGTAQWSTFSTLFAGGTVILSTDRAMEAHQLWGLVERERVSHLVLVGDAFALPLVEALESQPHRWHLDGVTVILNGGAILSPSVRHALLRHLPGAIVVDGYGTSETGGQGRMIVSPGQHSTGPPCFQMNNSTALLDELHRPLSAGSTDMGRLAKRGRIPLGYFGDPDRTSRTFPTVDGERWAITGDMGRITGTGEIMLLGRVDGSINSGGEKIYPEEVEATLKAHPLVFDAVVVGVPDGRFGERVAAVVAPRERAEPTLEELTTHCRTLIAGFKIPRQVVLVDRIRRFPTGKPDYQWARQRAESPNG